MESVLALLISLSDSASPGFNEMIGVAALYLEEGPKDGDNLILNRLSEVFASVSELDRASILFAIDNLSWNPPGPFGRTLLANVVNSLDKSRQSYDSIVNWILNNWDSWPD